MNNNPLKVIENDAQFEDLCCAIAQYKYGDFDAQRYGRSGQKQWGIDIRATDRKANNERIVIQCKFKNTQPTFKRDAERTTIKKEIESELAYAIKGNTFDYFVYAANIPRDTHLQDFAASLSTEDYTVLIWSQDDISEDIYRYHRLKEMYTLGGNKFGVEIINTDFIDTLELEEENAKPNIFRYYTSSDINNTQWYGILKDWDVIRSKQHVNFLKNIHTSFASEFIESKVAGLMLGEGGAGKSVFLRRIAIDIAKNHKDIVVWWVTDLKSFWLRDRSDIDDNPQYKHLIIIEDWYRNIGNDRSYSKPMFNWLKNKQHTRVVIGDRIINNGYKTFITKRNTFEISLDENFRILKTITEKLPQLNTNIQKLLEYDLLIRSSPIFVILFVLSELSENDLDIDYDQLNFENLFKDLIGKKVSTLDNDPRYRGIGKALYICAMLYSDTNSNYFRLPKDAFLLIAEFLGNNYEISDRIKTNDKFPELFDSLVEFENFSFKNGTNYNRLRFNHDLIAEKGITFINDTKYSLNFSLDAYVSQKLISFCLDHKKIDTALKLFIWLNYKYNYYEVTHFFNFFERYIQLLSGGGLINYSQILTKEKKKAFTKRILNYEKFYNLPKEIIAHSLRIWQDDQFGQDKAKEILNQKEFFKLPYDIVSYALRILQNDSLGIDKAKEILNQKEFFKLSKEIVSHALRTLQNNSLGIDKAKEILNQKEFLKLPTEIVSFALKICQHDEFGIQKAEEVLNQEKFFNLPHQTVSNALRIFQSDLFGKDKAKEILNQKEFLKLPHDIVSHALRILQSDPLGKDKSKEILIHLEKNKNIDYSIIFNALKSLSVDSNPKTNEIIKNTYNQIITLRKVKKFGRLYYQLLYIPLFQIYEHRKRVWYILNKYTYNCNTHLKNQLFKVLNCYKEYPQKRLYGFNFKEFSQQVLSNWREDLDHQKEINTNEYIDIHIALCLSNIHSKPTAKKISQEIVTYCEGNMILTRQSLYKTATEILENETYEFWE